jgi:hypothetical protein
MTQKQVDKLITDFVEAAKKHYEATMVGNWRETNKQAKRIRKVFQGIKSAGENARQALLAQTENQDLAVASMAATYSLKYGTQQAQMVLQHIASEPGIIGFGAQRALQRWEEGDWHLDED